MHESLADSLAIVLPSLGPALVDEEGSRRLLAMAGRLPPVHRGGLEFRLGPGESRVDIQQGVAVSEDGPALLAEHLERMARSGARIPPGWDRVRALAAEWRNPSSPLRAGVWEVWLELDVLGTGSETAAPSIFVGLRPPERTADAAVNLALSALRVLQPGGFNPAITNCLIRASDACVDGGRIVALGVMLGRRTSPIRINVGHLPQARWPEFLRNIGWRGDVSAVQELGELLLDAVDGVRLCLDTVGTFLPRIGLEAYFRPTYGLDPRWRPLLDELVARELCDPAKRDALLEWTGPVMPWRSPAPWPASLVARSLLMPSDTLGVIGLAPSHVKLTFAPEEPLSAKAYLGFMHVWATHRPAHASALIAARPSVERVAAGPLDAAVVIRTALASVDTTGYSKAQGPRAFRFPEDHGPHPDFLIEWWYFTGNVDAADGRRFGYQLTFFRRALAPEPPPIGPAHGFMAHLALTDQAGESFRAYDRLSGDDGGKAGAHAWPSRIWLGNWSAREAEDGVWRLRAGEGEIALDLELRPAKPPVLQGEEGLSRKGPEPGNASYYYSMSRLLTAGTLSLAGARHDVTGLSWMDREWSTSPLARGLRGWDWFALQLEDGRELVYGQIRDARGQASVFAAGSLILADGRKVSLAHEDVVLDVLAWWESPTDGARYPAQWRVRVPGHDIDLQVKPVIPDQELKLSILRYWEGAVDVTGTSKGRGYVELTGYAARESP